MSLLYDSASLMAAPIGSVIALGSYGIPPGYLLCDGSQLSQTTYASLYAAIGNLHGVFGGNFCLPDYRGYFLRGVNAGTGNDPDAGSRGAPQGTGQSGDFVGSLQLFSFQNHGHFFSDPGHQHGNNPNGWSMDPNGQPGAGIGGFSGAGPTALTTLSYTSASISGANSGLNSTETRPRNAYVHYVIRYQ